jgi:hypothetical protein
MPAPALRLSDRQLKAVKAKDKDYVLSDGDGPTNPKTTKPAKCGLCCIWGLGKLSDPRIPQRRSTAT